MKSVGFLGPPGTFGEQALVGQPDLAALELVPMRTMADVLRATETGQVDYGFVGLENSIEGSVRPVLDHLIFESDLFIQREVVLPISQNLVAPKGLTLDRVERVVSFPDALEQCRGFFSRELPDVQMVAATSTAEAVRLLAEGAAPATAALGTTLAARLYGLEVLAAEIEDHPENATRFVLVARGTIPAPTGNDKTSIVCFQRDDRPGNLHRIAALFAAREINLTKFESRPTKRGLGDYCFIIDFRGHFDDAPVADCLRSLFADLAGVKLLGSYPASNSLGVTARPGARAVWQAADDWIASLRAHIAR